MGNTPEKASTSHEYGDVFLTLDKDIVAPNETITGTIYLNVKKDYPASSLSLRILGHEKTHFVQAVNICFSTERYHRTESREIINSVIEISKYNEKSPLKPGQYSYSFQFTMPEGLLPSMFFKSHSDYAHISYLLIASLNPPVPVREPPKGTLNTIIETNKPDFYPISFEYSIQVVDTPKLDSDPGEMNVNDDLEDCKCIKSGRMNMRAYFNRGIFTEGDDCNIAVEVDLSESKIDITHLKFLLTQVVTLKAHGHTKHLDFVVKTFQKGKIKQKDKLIEKDRREETFKIPALEEFTSKYLEQDTHHTPEFHQFNPTMITSLKGALIKNEYYLNIVCNLEGYNWFTEDPRIDFPIKIYPKIKKIPKKTIEAKEPIKLELNLDFESKFERKYQFEKKMPDIVNKQLEMISNPMPTSSDLGRN